MIMQSSQSSTMLLHKRAMLKFKFRKPRFFATTRDAIAVRRRWLKNGLKRKNKFVKPVKERSLRLALWRAFNFHVHAGTELPF